MGGIQQGLSLSDEPAVSALASALRLDVEDGRVVVNDTDITRAVRTPEIDKAATAVARMPTVREILVERQRALAGGGGVVMEGRDIGTVVFPDADVKIYLDASPEERARRRAADPAHGGGPQELAAVATALAARDKIDTTRAVSPLTMASDACSWTRPTSLSTPSSSESYKSSESTPDPTRSDPIRPDPYLSYSLSS